MSEQVACGCQRIYYQPVDLEDGHFRERWRCITCKSEFVRAAEVAAFKAELAHFERFKLFLKTMGGIDVEYAWNETLTHLEQERQ